MPVSKVVSNPSGDSDNTNTITTYQFKSRPRWMYNKFHIIDESMNLKNNIVSPGAGSIELTRKCEPDLLDDNNNNNVKTSSQPCSYPIPAAAEPEIVPKELPKQEPTIIVPQCVPIHSSEDEVTVMAHLVNTPCLHQVVEKIFLNLNFKDLLAWSLVNSSCRNILEKPLFWLKKCVHNGMSKKNHDDWYNAIKNTRNTNLEINLGRNQMI